jgi:hypothetical protein
MGDEQFGYEDQYMNELGLKIRDIEEKQRILKERMILIGENLVDLREKTTKENLEVKKNIIIIQEQLNKMLSFLETASSEMTKFARKDDVEILYKQARMFQPLENKRKE